MMRLEGDTLKLVGAVTLETVPALIEALDSQFKAGARRMDFADVAEVDSSALALALEWRRHAAGQALQVSVVNTPQAMQNLANLYGVAELIQATA